MMRSTYLSLVAAIAVAAVASTAEAKTTQTPGNVFDGRSFLYVEAESFSARGGPGDPDVDGQDYGGFIVVSTADPIDSVCPDCSVPILPGDSNASGGTAIIDNVGGGQHSHTATYEVEFITAGTYQFYTRHSMFDANGNGNYGNEDSIFVSPGFNLNSSSDWVDFEGLEFNDAIGEIPQQGFALDPNGFEESVAEHQNEGWFALRDWGVKSEGDVVFNNNATEDFWNGRFHWYNRPAYVSVNSGGGFDDDFGFKTEFIVTEDMLNQTLTFEIGTREVYGAFDGFLFIQDDLVDLLDIHSQEDLDDTFLRDFARGDFDKDGDVDGDDFLAWQAGFGTTEGASQADGDADGDGDVDGDDFLLWQADFGSGSGNGAGVPEPTSAMLVLLAGLFAACTRRR